MATLKSLKSQRPSISPSSKNTGYASCKWFIAELAERSPIIIKNSSSPSSRKKLDVRPYDRTTVRPYDRTTVRPYDPTTLRPYDPTNLRPYDPTTLRPYDPTTLRPYDPTTLRPYDPTTLRSNDPTTLRPYDPTTLRPYKVLLLTCVFNCTAGTPTPRLCSMLFVNPVVSAWGSESDDPGF